MLKGFLDGVGPPVLKAARGGYDGRGVLPQSRVETISMIDELSKTTSVVVEERLRLRSELALVVVRGSTGTPLSLVSTVQSNGMCVEVRFPPTSMRRPNSKPIDSVERSRTSSAPWGCSPSSSSRATGVVRQRDRAAPHNTGHWTIEVRARVSSRTTSWPSAVAPWFDRADRGLGGDGERRGRRRARLDRARRRVPGARARLRKAWRPGRKLGHVTVVATTPAPPT